MGDVYLMLAWTYFTIYRVQEQGIVRQMANSNAYVREDRCCTGRREVIVYEESRWKASGRFELLTPLGLASSDLRFILLTPLRSAAGTITQAGNELPQYSISYAPQGPPLGTTEARREQGAMYPSASNN